MRSRPALAVVALIAGAAVEDLGAQSTPALFPITVDDKHGYIHTTGALVIPAMLDRR